MSKSKIEWTDAVWNPVTGCSKVSDGCRNCYAERMSKRLAGRCGYPKDNPFKVTVHQNKFIEPLTWRKPRRVFVNSMSDLFHPDVQDDWILAVFVAMGLTYEHTGEMKEVSPGHKVGIHKPKHTFMILTKRPQRMRDFIVRLMSKEPDEEWDKKAHYYAAQLSGMNGAIFPGNAIFTFSQWLVDGMPGLWLGVSVENQATADERITLLLQTPAAVRFISAEPLLGPINIEPYLIPLSEKICKNCWQFEEPIYSEQSGRCRVDKYSRPYANTKSCSQFEDRYAEDFEAARDWVGSIDWVITGGESGPGARPVHPDWVRSLRDQCQLAGVKFYFKSWGEWFVPEDGADACRVCGCTWNNACDGGCYWAEPGLCSNCVGKSVPIFRAVKYQRIGKKKAGRCLDDRIWDELPGATNEGICL